MASEVLRKVLDNIRPPILEASEGSAFAVVPVPSYESYFVGKDGNSFACILISSADVGKPSYHHPIRLANLDVQFQLLCSLMKEGEAELEGRFTVVRCRSMDVETTDYFLSICEALLRILGDRPKATQIASAVNRVASIFQKIRRSPLRPVNGLFGELYFLLRSSDVSKAVAAWRVDSNSRFDFTVGNCRVEVKTASGRRRLHEFSYEQCNPPESTVAVVASLHVEEVSSGKSIESVMREIESRISADVDLVLKFHETIAGTLGRSLEDGLSRCFDMRLADSSLRFFSLREISAIRGVLPRQVSHVKFRSDLSAVPPVSINSLIERDPDIGDLLPKPD